MDNDSILPHSKPESQTLWSVSDLLGFTSDCVKALGLIKLEGEIAQMVRAKSWHWYFDLKDSHSRLKCVMFSSHVRQLSFDPKVGDSVCVTGKVDIFKPRGDFQFYVHQMEAQGLGILFQNFLLLKNVLKNKACLIHHENEPLHLILKILELLRQNRARCYKIA